MAQEPYAYDKSPGPPPSRARFWLGVGLLAGSLVLVAVVLWQLRPKKGPMPVEDARPAQPTQPALPAQPAR